ncbi:MAG: acyltransferase [Chitinophagaceae bacterium]|nr:acyltransferase [Chitinophagaceae bacterium]
MQHKRLEILDFYRFVAIFIVMLFHYFTRWTTPFDKDNLYPYENQYDYFVWGRLGVQFFFIISGFVISMTLEKSHDALDFAKKRILRLWPSMVLVSSITFLVFTLFDTQGIFPISKQWSNLLYSWTFLGKKLNNQGWGYIDGSYWSLWVEVQFYIFAALLYYVMRKLKTQQYFPYLLFATAVITCFAKPWMGEFNKVYNLFLYINFFVMGVIFKELFSKESPFNLKFWYYHAMILTAILLEVKFYSDDMQTRLVNVIWVIAFYAFIYFGSKQMSPKGTWWTLGVYLGEASYVSYLIHQNIGILIISKIGYKGPFSYLVPLGVIALLFGIGAILYRFYEKPLMAYLKSKWFKKPAVSH